MPSVQGTANNIRENSPCHRPGFAAITIASTCAYAWATPAGAQLLTTRTCPPIAITIAQTAIETCKANGYAVSATVVGRNGEIICRCAATTPGRTPWRTASARPIPRAPSARLGRAGRAPQGRSDARPDSSHQRHRQPGRAADQGRRRGHRRGRRLGRAGRRKGRGLHQGRDRQGRRSVEMTPIAATISSRITRWVPCRLRVKVRRSGLSAVARPSCESSSAEYPSARLPRFERIRVAEKLLAQYRRRRRAPRQSRSWRPRMRWRHFGTMAKETYAWWSINP